MTTINLLPWRDAYRQEKKREFFSVLILTIIVTLAGCYVWYSAVQLSIDGQLARNNFLNAEIDLLNQKVKEISQLKAQRRDLESKTEVIQGLQYKRPLVVYYVDELVKNLPDGVYFKRLSRADSLLSISGMAESNTGVSALMRNLDDSDFFDSPKLINVVKDKFELTVNLVVPESFSTLAN